MCVCGASAAGAGGGSSRGSGAAAAADTALSDGRGETRLRTAGGYRIGPPITPIQQVLTDILDMYSTFGKYSEPFDF